MIYALITPAKNEEVHLPKEINSILSQTVKPVKWVIVSDGSTDKTDSIVEKAKKKCPFIELIRLQDKGIRSFGSKALAFSEGYKTLKKVNYKFIGNLDADITFEPTYYQKILAEMEKNQGLGVASGVCWDKTENGFKRVNSSLNHAVGAVQLWRRECFEEIGGYKPATVGGIDAIAELTARMLGWETRSFPSIPVFHHKPVDSANAKTGIHISYRAGLTEYHIGTSPIFALIKSIKHWRQSPAIISSFVRTFAYMRLWTFNKKRDASEELVAFVKAEQHSRIIKYFQKQKIV